MVEDDRDGEVALKASNGKHVGVDLNPSLLDFYRNTLEMQSEIYKRQDNLTAKLDEIISLLKSKKT